MPFRSRRREPYLRSRALPEQQVANALILAGGGFTAAPSANTSGRPSPTKAEHVIEDLGDKIDCIIDGGDAEIGLESTIVDFTEEIPTILRPGYYNKEMLEKVLGTVRVDPGILAEDSHGVRRHRACATNIMRRRQTSRLSGRDGTGDSEINRLAAEQEKAGKKVGAICTDTEYIFGSSTPQEISRASGLRAEMRRSRITCLRFCATSMRTAWKWIYSEAFDTPRMGAGDLEPPVGRRPQSQQRYNKSETLQQDFVCGRGRYRARAPMAKAILQSKELPWWPMEIGSRGLVVLFPQPVNQKVEAVLARNGLSAKDHTTTPLTAEDINDDTLLLVMEDSQREKIREDFPDAPHLQTIAGFLRLAGDIPALYGEPLTEYGKCYEALEFLIEGVLARLKEEEEQ